MKNIYVGKLFTTQDIKGTNRNYDDLKEVYQITILDKDRFLKDEDFFHIRENSREAHK